MNKELKILIQSKDEGAIVKANGTKIGLMYALATLSETLLKDSNLSEKDIRYAIDLGLMSEKEIEDDLKKQNKEFTTKIKELFKEIFD